MVKLKDIAKACNTSIATVSRALNNSPELSKETIDKVMKTAKEMGYVPNAYARALKSKKSFNIGVIYYDATYGGLKHEYFSSILNALKVEAEQKGFSITFLSKRTNKNMTYLQLARYLNMDGVVIVTEEFDNPEITELVNSDFPTVTIDYIFNSCTAIMSDNTEGMKKLVHFAYDLGHKDIAFIHGETTDVTKKRLASFYAGMSECNLEINPDFVLQGAFHNPKACGHLTKELMSGKKKPTCILATDDISMIGCLSALSELGYDVPKDVSVIGYDGIDLSRFFRPKFTTYIQNSEELGKEAARQLIDRIYSPLTFVPTTITVSGEIQVGSTTAKAKTE